MTKYTPEQWIIAFWSKVNKDGSIPAHMPHLGKCWEWTSSINTYGYGYTRWYEKTSRSHRLSWIITNGAIPDGLWVLHKCDNRKCVNPEHLFLGTRQDNIDDMNNKLRGKGRITKGQIRKEISGDKHPLHKITDVQVLEIRERYAKQDTTLAVLARDYGVWPQQISRIVRKVQRKLD